MRAPNFDSVLARPISDFISDDFLDLFEDGLGLLAEEPDGVPLNFLTTSGEPMHVHFHVTLLEEYDGHEIHIVECQDISDLIKASHSTRDREQRLNAILETVDQAIFTIDEFGIIKSVNDTAEKVFGYAQSDMLNHNINMLMPEPHHSKHDSYLVHYLSGKEHSNVIGQTREHQAIRADGTLFPIELAVTEVVGSDGRTTFVGSIRDITLQKEQEDRIRFLALNDALTGLPNRASFNDKIDNAVLRAERNKTGIALLFIDLDKFKPINDTLGHEAGDIVLKTVGQRLTETIRETDTAARLGGDEFVLILEGIPEKEGAVEIAKKLLKAIPEPIDVGTTDCSVGISIGISHYPTDAKDIPELLSAADRAMYNVKEAGRNNYAFC